jgi:hypothetical protein
VVLRLVVRDLVLEGRLVLLAHVENGARALRQVLLVVRRAVIRPALHHDGALIIIERRKREDSEEAADLLLFHQGKSSFVPAKEERNLERCCGGASDSLQSKELLLYCGVMRDDSDFDLWNAKGGNKRLKRSCERSLAVGGKVLLSHGVPQSQMRGGESRWISVHNT